MKPVMTIADPEAFKILADETRRRILYLLRAKEMTVSQIADELDLTPQTVYHHIKRLLEAEMVEVTREVRVDHLIESYYRATAEMFYLTVGKKTQSKETLEASLESVLNALKKLGFNVKYDKEDVAKLAEIKMEKEDCCSTKEYEDAVSKLDDVDYFAKQEVAECATVLSMSEEQLKKDDEIDNKFRDLLRSLVVKKPQQP